MLNYYQNITIKYSQSFTGKERDSETGFSYFGARYYDSDLMTGWLSVDPLADKYPSLSPYAYCANNPVRLVDPDGRVVSPIYDTDGNFLGTDDNGLQGEALIMNKANFSQGMSNKEARTKGRTLDNMSDMQALKFANNGNFKKFLDHYNSLSSRPDWDGSLTLSEANEWYRNGNGASLFVDINTIDLSGIVSLGEKYVGLKKTFNLLICSNDLQDGLVFGNITLKRYPNHSVRSYSDKYDFNMHSWKNPLNWPRNFETLIGRLVAGKGVPYEINIYGIGQLNPIIPWIK